MRALPAVRTRIAEHTSEDEQPIDAQLLEQVRGYIERSRQAHNNHDQILRLIENRLNVAFNKIFNL